MRAWRFVVSHMPGVSHCLYSFLSSQNSCFFFFFPVSFNLLYLCKKHCRKKLWKTKMCSTYIASSKRQTNKCLENRKKKVLESFSVFLWLAWGAFACLLTWKTGFSFVLLLLLGSEPAKMLPVTWECKSALVKYISNVTIRWQPRCSHDKTLTPTKHIIVFLSPLCIPLHLKCVDFAGRAQLTEVHF